MLSFSHETVNGIASQHSAAPDTHPITEDQTACRGADVIENERNRSTKASGDYPCSSSSQVVPGR